MKLDLLVEEKLPEMTGEAEERRGTRNVGWEVHGGAGNRDALHLTW